MEYGRKILETTLHQPRFDREILARCIEACFSCGQACTACADACLAEDSVTDLARCIRLNLDCADICDVTGRVLSRQFAIDVQLARTLVEACGDACRSCGDECERHWEALNMEPCRVCAEACRMCEQACSDLLGAAA